MPAARQCTSHVVMRNVEPCQEARKGDTVPAPRWIGCCARTLSALPSTHVSHCLNSEEHACVQPLPLPHAPGSICKYVCGVLKDKLLGRNKEWGKEEEDGLGLGKTPVVSF